MVESYHGIGPHAVGSELGRQIMLQWNTPIPYFPTPINVGGFQVLPGLKTVGISGIQLFHDTHSFAYMAIMTFGWVFFQCFWIV